MKTFLSFVGLMGLSAVLIVLGVILGDYASWYFAWIVGTAMIVLVSAAGLAWLDAQQAGGDDGPPPGNRPLSTLDRGQTSLPGRGTSACAGAAAD